MILLSYQGCPFCDGTDFWLIIILMKNLLYTIVFLFLSITVFWFAQGAAPPDFLWDFAAPLVSGEESVYTFWADGSTWIGDIIDPNRSLTDNLKNIFYPPIFGDEAQSWGELWRLIRNIWVWILVVMLIWAGGMFVRNPSDPEAMGTAIKNMIYIIYGVALFFWVTRLLGTVLNVWDFNGLLGTWDNDGLVNKLENNIILQLIWFLKALAFFVAIVFTAWYGFKMATAVDAEDKVKAAKSGLLNVIVALVFIKVIDYIYYVAQVWDIQSTSMDVIISVSKFFWFLFGWLLFLSFLYVGFLYLTSAWSEERVKTAWTYLRNLIVVMLVVFLFLLIVYQIFADISL